MSFLKGVAAEGDSGRGITLVTRNNIRVTVAFQRRAITRPGSLYGDTGILPRGQGMDGRSAIGRFLFSAKSAERSLFL